MPSSIPDILRRNESDILADWIRVQLASIQRRSDLMREADLREQSTEFLRLLVAGVQSGNVSDVDGASWASMREMLAGVSRSRTVQGFTPTETATFVFSLKPPLFALLRREVRDGQQLTDEFLIVNDLLDKLGLFTTEVYQRAREEIIQRQQQDMLELSTPVVSLHDGILALPLIGTLDSSRTQTVMEALLQRIVDSGSEIAIIDITGVPTVDTLTAQHLLKTVTATRLMGADCIISGIRPQIAQTIVHLGVNLGDVTTKATLASAFQLALQRRGLTIQTKRAAQAGK